MNQLNIESLFGDPYPNTSFHDSAIQNINIDFLSSTVTFHCNVCVGDPESPETKEDMARGVLTFTGLQYILFEPPNPPYPFDEEALGVSDDGPIETTKFKSPIPKLPGPLPRDAFEHYFYISNWNSFIFLAATGARFEWT